MLVLRKVVFYILALVYILCAPLVIMYALGYIVKPESKKPVVGTGLIHLASLPPGAFVYLNNKPYNAATPASLGGLLPGEYDVKIFLEGYGVWEAVVSVEAGKAVAFDKILLLPEIREKETLIEGRFENVIPVEEAPFLLVKKSERMADCLVYGLRENEYIPLAGPDSEYSGYRVVSCFTADKSRLIILRVSGSGGGKFLWIDISFPDVKIIDITGLFTERPERISWDASDKNNIFYFSGRALGRLDVNSRAVYPDFAENARGFGIYDRQVYVLTGDNLVISTDYGKNRENSLLDDAALAASIFGESGYFEILPFARNIILFLGQDGRLISNRLPYTFIESGVRGVKFDDTQERVLAWQSGKIGVLDFLTEETGNVVFEKGPAFEWVYEEGRDIEQAFWAYDGSHVIFRDGKSVFLLGLERPGARRIADVKTGSSVFYSDDTGFLYYLDPEDGNFTAMQVVPGSPSFPQESAGELPKNKEKEK